MTNEEAKIVIGNIPIKPEVLDDCYSITEYQEAKTMAIKALEQTKWIPCAERLPEKDGYYLVTTKWKSRYLGNVYIDATIARYREKPKEWTYNHVIAWMPLPHPYKAESEGEK